MPNVNIIDGLDVVMEAKRQISFDVFTVTDFNAWANENENDIRIVAHNRYAETIHNLDLQVTDEQITITTKTPDPWHIEDTTVITWDQLSNNSSFSGADCWLLNMQGVDVHDPANEKVAGKHEPIFNILPLTSDNKNNVTGYVKSIPANKFYTFYRLYVRPGATKFTDCFHHLDVSTATEITSNLDYTRAINPNPAAVLSPPAYDVMFRLGARWTSQTADGGLIEVGLMNNANIDIYAKSDVGHIPRKVSMSAGRATIRFSSIGMESGEQAEIKLGFKWFSNSATLVYTKP